MERDGIEFKTSNYPSNHLNHLTMAPRAAYTRNVFEFPPRQDSEKKLFEQTNRGLDSFLFGLKVFLSKLDSVASLFDAERKLESQNDQQVLSPPSIFGLEWHHFLFQM